MRRLARHITSKASPSNGIAPTTPSSATLHQHARDDMARRAERAGLAHDVERDHRGDGVADAGDEADDGVEAEADVGAGKDERGVEQIGERVEPRDPLGPRLPRKVK